MNIITHFFIGWNAGLRFSRQMRDTVLLTAASTIPDIDGVGAVVDLIRGGEAEFFSAWHHKFGHCGLFCLLLVPAVYLLSRRNWRLTAWFVAIFHLHLLCDVIGARGPDGYQWPVYYLWPFSDAGLTWSGQWHINAWPNIVLTCLLLADFLRQSARAGFTPLRIVSRGADCVLVATLQNRFGGQNEPE
ncbi:MAG: metal-dependent hydrolase [Candidatus Riflebacteria bacterium HGW-Riflebacteria-2]|jgi:hypothetical protein|nr:MAG: metal-dependent hydrolase [Candidatus Riflebacteria bacterium HGW-Riflebacteria-2]